MAGKIFGRDPDQSGLKANSRYTMKQKFKSGSPMSITRAGFQMTTKILSCDRARFLA